MNLVDELHAVAAVLARDGVPYAVCGGIAVTIHGAPRMTKDIDLVVGREDVNRVLDAVRPLGYTFVALPMVFGEGTPSERHVQRVSKVVDKDHLLLDLLIAERALAGVLDDRVQLSLPEGPLAVVSRATLIRMKQLADRDQDRADVAALEAGDGA